MVLLTTRPKRDGTAYDRAALEHLAARLNDGTATAHPLKVETARVVEDDDGHASLLIDGGWPEGVSR